MEPDPDQDTVRSHDWPVSNIDYHDVSFHSEDSQSSTRVHDHDALNMEGCAETPQPEFEHPPLRQNDFLLAGPDRDLLRSYNHDSGLGMGMSTTNSVIYNPNSIHISPSASQSLSKSTEETEDVHLTWYHMLFSLFMIIGRQAPTPKQLGCLSSLTMASQQALINWFKEMACTSAFSKLPRNPGPRTTLEAWNNMLYNFYTAIGQRMPDDAELFWLHGLTDQPESDLRNWFQAHEGLQSPFQVGAQVLGYTFQQREVLNGPDDLLGHSSTNNGYRKPTEDEEKASTPVLLATASHGATSDDLAPGSIHSQLDSMAGVSTSTPLRTKPQLRISSQRYPQLYRFIFNDIKRREIRCSEGKNEKGVGKHVCHLGCGKHFQSPFERDRHQDERFPRQYWFCTLCGDVHRPKFRSLFVRKDKIRKHLKAHAQTYPGTDVSDDSFKLEDIPMTTTCGLCNEHVNILRMQQHVLAHVNKGVSMDHWNAPGAYKQSSTKRKRTRPKRQDSADDDDSDDDDNDNDGNTGNMDASAHASQDQQDRTNVPNSQTGGRDTMGGVDPELGNCMPADHFYGFSEEKVRTEIDHFKAHINSTAVQSYDGRKYIPPREIKAYFNSKTYDGAKTRLSQLLELSCFSQARAWTAEIQSKYLKVLAILLYINRGDMLPSFLKADLNDDDLPLQKEPYFTSLSYPATGAEERLKPKPWWLDFEEMQWKFCAPTFDYHQHVDWSDQIILPIVSMEPLNEKGGTARVWKVEIHPDYLSDTFKDHITPRKTSHTTAHSRQTFVLKSFHSCQEKLFERERSALLTLRDHASIVKYYGSFSTYNNKTQERTHNIVLEHAEEGDLEEFFADHDPPTKPADVSAFWNSLLSLPESVEAMHKFTLDNRVYHGWHADIKPANILVTSNEGYDCQFKLADFGLGSFRLKEKGGVSDEVRVLGGTKTFSAPEVNMREPPILSSVPAAQAIDAWSLGCVLSEVSTWVLLGFDGLDNFRRLRQEECRNLSLLESDTPDKRVHGDMDCFHDGKDVLMSVRRWHQELRKQCQEKDSLTMQILDIVDSSLLTSDLRERFTAEQLYAKFKDVVDTARVDDITLNDSLDCKPLYSHVKGLPAHPHRDTIRNKRQSQLSLHQTLRADLDDRDFTLIVDDSHSMQSHWEKLTVFLEVLSCKLNQMNDDGVDLYFSVESENRKGHSTPKFLADDDNHGIKDKNFKKCLRNESNLEQLLASQLRKHLAGRQKRKKTVFVLTDGSWGEERQGLMERMLSDFDRLRRDQTSEDRFDVQFIRFGDDQKARDRLARMNNMRQHYKSRDFVGTASASECVEVILENYAKKVHNAASRTRGRDISVKSGRNSIKHDGDVPDAQMRSPLSTQIARSSTVRVDLSISKAMSLQWISAKSVPNPALLRDKALSLTFQLSPAMRSVISMGLCAMESAYKSLTFVPFV